MFAEKGKNNRMSSFVDKLWNDKTLHEETFKDTDDYLVRLEIKKKCKIAIFMNMQYKRIKYYGME